MARCQPTLGYLSVVHLAGHGWVGGLLVVTLVGRPVEFHCTLPVQPNRAQQILYGPTVAAMIHGEQIGQALLERLRPDTEIVWTDQGESLWARDFARCPLVWIRAADWAAEAVRPAGRSQTTGNYLLTAHLHHGDDLPQAERLVELADDWDLLEPFQRIHSAIDEAQKAA